MFCDGNCSSAVKNTWGWKPLSVRRDETERVNAGIVQELCESQGGHPGLSVLRSLMFFVDINYDKAILNRAHALVSAYP